VIPVSGEAREALRVEAERLLADRKCRADELRPGDRFLAHRVPRMMVTVARVRRRVRVVRVELVDDDVVLVMPRGYRVERV